MGGTEPTASVRRRRRRSESEVVPYPRDSPIMQTFFSNLVKFIATDMQPIQVVENEDKICFIKSCRVVGY
jgi:hypothetical protein